MNIERAKQELKAKYNELLKELEAKEEWTPKEGEDVIGYFDENDYGIIGKYSERHGEEHIVETKKDGCVLYFKYVKPLHQKPQWIKWEGGECPCPEANFVVVKHRDGKVYMSGNHNDWCHAMAWVKAGCSTIIEYLVLDDYI